MTDVQEKPWFLTGNYAPIGSETTAHDLDVTGSLPPGLSGRYLRNGSNPARGAAAHWFFGDGMVHGIRLEGGRATWYRSRWVRTTKLEKGLEATDEASMFDPTASAANTHVLAHAGRIWALEEGHLPYELSPDLDTVGPDDFGGRLTTAFTAHPKRCPETGELHFFGYGVMPPYLTYHVLDASGDLVHSAPITVPGPTMMHDFMITREHAIFMDLPVVFDLDALGRGEVPLHWDDDYGARIGVLPRFGTDREVRWFEVDPCYVFHPLNAYDDGDRVVLDVVRHDRMFDQARLGPDEGPPALCRWTVDPAAGVVKEERLDDRPAEFPRVDERVVGRPHRYGWAASLTMSDDGLGFDGSAVVKYDLERGTSERHELGTGCSTGEAVFIPSAPEAPEDDGWVMSLVYDATTDRSDLVILAATDITGEPVATVHLPQRVPYGFHGNWVPDQV